ncbi:MAG: transposase [Aphanocapsa sp. GSE-SYN-MK-11-07L]|jgi:transposase|nr:transposase [Aphanocapsa sp. GSE-SYN-MK-11-07L]
MLTQHIDFFRRKPVNVPKVNILLDQGYHPQHLIAALEQVYPQIMTKIRFQLAPKPTKADKAAQGKSGFVPIPQRWIIERSNAWVDRCNSLVKNFERTLEHANTKLKLCFIRLLLRRLTAT